MAPQPLSRVYPNASVEFNASTLLRFPSLAARAMIVINHWSYIDSMLAEILTLMLKSDYAPALSMFQALVSAEARQAALIGAADTALKPDIQGSDKSH